MYLCTGEECLILVFVVKFYNMRNFVQRKHTHSHINFTTYKLMEMQCDALDVCCITRLQ